MKNEMYVERIPTWALCYLVNDDPSGLSEEDIRMVDEFVNKNNVSIVDPVRTNEDGDFHEYFSHYPAFGLGTDVVDCNIVSFI